MINEIIGLIIGILPMFAVLILIELHYKVEYNIDLSITNLFDILVYNLTYVILSIKFYEYKKAP
jgi:hypothetical protein